MTAIKSTFFSRPSATKEDRRSWDADSSTSETPEQSSSPGFLTNDRNRSSRSLEVTRSGLSLPGILRRSKSPEALHGSMTAETTKLEIGKNYTLVAGRLYFSVHSSVDMSQNYIDKFPEFFYFSWDFHESYEPFCADFGPVNLGVVHSFIKSMRSFTECPILKKRKLVYYCFEDMAHRTNCAFLLAAYMVVEMGFSPENAWAPFDKIGKDVFTPFRDATWLESDYHLTILHCLKGLRKAVDLGWYNPKTFNEKNYFHLSNANIADMSVLSPKFIAMRGPRDKPDEYCFSPEHYMRIMKVMKVSSVVRLNKPETYDAQRFKSKGFQHHDLYFDDCTTPSREIVDKFLEIAERAEGPVAVHCDAGLGRTGTLVALYLIKHHGFTATECIGWLRIARPGSIIGEQQHYLHWAEKHLFRKPTDKTISHEGETFTQRRQLSHEETEALGKMVLNGQQQKGQRVSEQPSEGSSEPDELREHKQEEVEGMFAWTHRISLEDCDSLNFGTILQGSDTPKSNMGQKIKVDLNYGIACSGSDTPETREGRKNEGVLLKNVEKTKNLLAFLQ